MEERINIRTEPDCSESAHTEYILAELEKARLEAEDPDTKWVSQDEMLAMLRNRQEARPRV
jgi:hypothetical protein